MNVKAEITLERLWLCPRRLMMRSEDGLMGTVVTRLMVLGGRSCRGRDVQTLIGQEERGRGRKLPFNQNAEFIWSQVVPDLVRRSAGF